MEKRRNWTSEERKILREYWGKYSITVIAKRLNRSTTAIQIQAGRRKLGGLLASSDSISLNTLIIALGLSYSSDSKKLINAGLKTHMQRVKKCSFRMVKLSDFWHFAEANKHLIDFSRLDKNALGKEPKWLKAKREHDRIRARQYKPHNAKWSDYEDGELRQLLKMYRYTYPELSVRLRRTEGAIQRRIIDLCLKERPLRNESHKWTDEQICTLRKLIIDGGSYEAISKAVGKSVKAVKGKTYAIYQTEKLIEVAKIIAMEETTK